jgi:lipid A 3-O-deacylase
MVANGFGDGRWAGMHCKALAAVAVGVFGALATVPARADDAIFSEVRVGVLDHDLHFLGGRESGIDFNGELLFVSPFSGLGGFLPSWLRWAAEPQPTIGASINSAGYTSQGYAALTWTVPLFTGLLRDNDGLSLGLSAGGALNNGRIEREDDHAALGSNALFRLGAEIGYQVTPRIGLYVLLDHYSNAGLARANDGITDLGVRVGWRF